MIYWVWLLKKLILSIWRMYWQILLIIFRNDRKIFTTGIMFYSMAILKYFILCWSNIKTSAPKTYLKIPFLSYLIKHCHKKAELFFMIYLLQLMIRVCWHIFQTCWLKYFLLKNVRWDLNTWGWRILAQLAIWTLFYSNFSWFRSLGIWFWTEKYLLTAKNQKWGIKRLRMTLCFSFRRCFATWSQVRRRALCQKNSAFQTKILMVSQ